MIRESQHGLTQMFRNPVTSEINGAFRRRHNDRLQLPITVKDPGIKPEILPRSHRCLSRGQGKTLRSAH